MPSYQQTPDIQAIEWPELLLFAQTRTDLHEAPDYFVNLMFTALFITGPRHQQTNELRREVDKLVGYHKLETALYNIITAHYGPNSANHRLNIVEAEFTEEIKKSLGHGKILHIADGGGESSYSEKKYAFLLLICGQR